MTSASSRSCEPPGPEPLALSFEPVTPFRYIGRNRLPL
jgi:hypothetical protein